MLKKWNNLKDDTIYIGQRLIVSQTEASQKTDKTASPTNSSKGKESKTVYIVQSGDTLTKIAKLYNVSIDDIKKWNNLKSDRIDVKQALTIYKTN
jgi:LysM repeat protein